MRWQGREESSNIEDRRSQGSGGFGGNFGGGGLGQNPFGTGGGMLPSGRSRMSLGSLGIIVVFLLIAWAFGINPLQLLNGDVSPDQSTSFDTNNNTLGMAGGIQWVGFNRARAAR